VLIGLGGLYGATAAVNTKNVAKAEPVMTPLVDKCGPADLPQGAVPTSCCPPGSAKAPKIFTPPGLDTPLRVRPAAHLVDQAYTDKFSEALRRMKALPADDPRSFKQQAMIHCAYCDGAYDQAGLPNIELQVHNSWLFFPFHRCYLYYFERILGSLINDPTFAIPYWNWDSAGGMKMPSMYTNPKLPMFNVFRDPNHMPSKMIDLDFGDATEHDSSHDNFSESQMAEHNLAIMYRQMRTNSSTPEMFFGKAYKAGDKPNPGGGSIENTPHNTVHDWVGDPLQPNHEDMGNLYSAGRDPIFYAHHSNIDRMWNIWKTLGRRNIDICDSDWLNASFNLYDENAELVQITVADCLDSERLMRYKYQDVPIEWLDKKPQVTITPKTRSLELRPILKEAQFPLVLDAPVRTTVRRPKTNRSDVEKKATEEVLKISGIQFDRDIRVKFDVFVNAYNHKTVAPAGRELIGSFTHVPHKHKHDKMGMGLETSIQFGLTEVIDDLGINGNETIELTLVPKQGQGKVTVSGIKIDLTS
jgi:polyphenol oxidase